MPTLWPQALALLGYPGGTVCLVIITKVKQLVSTSRRTTIKLFRVTYLPRRFYDVFLELLKFPFPLVLLH